MGRNTNESRSVDQNWGYDETKKSPFKFSMPKNMEQSCRMLEASQGLEFASVNMVIYINGRSVVTQKDTLMVKGARYKVVAIDPIYGNPSQGKRKGNLADYTGGMRVGLQS